MKPDLDRAAHEPTLIPAAIQQALTWSHEAGVFSLDKVLGPEIDSIGATVQGLVKVAYDDAAARCGSDMSAIGEMLGDLRFAQLLGIGTLDEGKLERCISFTLTVDSDFSIRKLLHRTVFSEEAGVLDDRVADDTWRAHAKLGPVTVDGASPSASRGDLLPLYADWKHHYAFTLCDTFGDGHKDCLGYEETWTPDLGDPEFPENTPVEMTLSLTGANPGSAPREPRFSLLLRFARGSATLRTWVTVSYVKRTFDYLGESTGAPQRVQDAGWYSGFSRIYESPLNPNEYVDHSTPGCEAGSAFLCLRYEIALGATEIAQSTESGVLDDTGKETMEEKTTITLGHPAP